MSSVLEAHGLHYGYARGDVVRDVSLAVPAGGSIGVIGPNGSGKTTLLRLLSGVATPRSGSVSLAGQPLTSYPRRDLARRLAVVPQDPRVDFPFTALEVVLMGRAPHLGRFGFPGRRDVELARAALARLDVDSLADVPLDHLSGGERQRVFLARALAQEPAVLLLDEPTVHLDLRHQIGIHDTVRELGRRQGLAVVTVLHDLNLAALYCEQLLLLDGGRVVARGAPAEVLTAERIGAVYGTAVTVAPREGGGPVVLPLPRAEGGERG